MSRFVTLLLGAMLITSCSSDQVTTIADTIATTTVDSTAPDLPSSEVEVAEPSEPNTLPMSDAPILDSAHATLDKINGWDRVDTWLHEPFGLGSSSNCSAFSEVIALEELGMPAALWLKDGAEIWQHSVNLDSAESAEAAATAIASLDESCGSVDFGGDTIVIEPGQLGDVSGISLVVPSDVVPTWLFEGGRTIFVTALSQSNVVVVMSYVPSSNGQGATDAIEFAEALNEVKTRLA